jgi:phosphatidate cytidylyltransferase
MLRERVITALILAALVLLVIFMLPHAATMAALALLVVAAAWEWSAFPRFTQHSARIFYVAFVAACVAATWWFGVEREEMGRLIQAALAWWVFALIWVVIAPAQVNRVTAAGAGLLVLVPAWLALARLHAAGPQLLLFLILLVVAADVGAYFAGRSFGRNKLAPRVSPGKTWEGALGGTAAALVYAIILATFIEGFSWVPYLLAATLVAILSIVGDLFESAAKRQAAVKDSGTLLPGHGGVLDRIDSATAALPAATLLLPLVRSLS